MAVEVYIITKVALGLRRYPASFMNLESHRYRSLISVIATFNGQKHRVVVMAAIAGPFQVNINRILERSYLASILPNLPTVAARNKYASAQKLWLFSFGVSVSISPWQGDERPVEHEVRDDIVR